MIPVLAACLLFLFCAGHHHHIDHHSHIRHQHHRSVPKPQDDSAVETSAPTPPPSSSQERIMNQNATGKSCDQITAGFDSWAKRDDFVSEFPVEQQRRVLKCLNKIDPGEPR